MAKIPELEFDIPWYSLYAARLLIRCAERLAGLAGWIVASSIRLKS